MDNRLKRKLRERRKTKEIMTIFEWGLGSKLSENYKSFLKSMKEDLRKGLLIPLIFLSSFVSAQCNWDGVGIFYTAKCKDYVFEMGRNDSCVSYSTIITMPNGDKAIFKDRAFKWTFGDTGKYEIRTAFKNFCNNCDTVIEKTIYVKCTVGLYLHPKVYSVIYPNPVEKILYIQYRGSPLLIKIHDSKGALVYKGYDKEINTSEWPNGMYFVKVGNSSASILIK